MAKTDNPSFLGSVSGGLKGTFKGLLAGASIGALVGGAGGAVIGLLTGGLAGIGGAAALGALIGAQILGGIGATAGTVTGVVQSRERSQPAAEDVVNLAKISLAQGMAIGHQIGQAEAQQQSTAFRDRIEKERAAQAQNPGQHLH